MQFQQRGLKVFILTEAVKVVGIVFIKIKIGMVSGVLRSGAVLVGLKPVFSLL